MSYILWFSDVGVADVPLVGGASALIGAWRVTFWGALAMAITAGVGDLEQYSRKAKAR